MPTRLLRHLLTSSVFDADLPWLHQETYSEPPVTTPPSVLVRTGPLTIQADICVASLAPYTNFFRYRGNEGYDLVRAMEVILERDCPDTQRSCRTLAVRWCCGSCGSDRSTMRDSGPRKRRAGHSFRSPRLSGPAELAQPIGSAQSSISTSPSSGTTTSSTTELICSVLSETSMAQ